MKILVTGGGGFLGVAVCKALAARGDTAIAFDAVVSPQLAKAASSEANIVVAQGDIADMANFCQTFKAHEPEAIIHCAAVVGVIASLSSPSNVFRVNVEGAINLFEAMRLYDVQRIIHISSEETYGAFQMPVATEDHPMNPLYAYGITKVAVEHLGRTYKLTAGLECINLRTSWVYGPEFPRLRVPRDLLEAAVDGRPLHLKQGGDSTVDHTYIDDFVAGTLLALDHPDHEFDAYHIASGGAPSLFEMVEMIKDLVPGADISVGGGVYQHAGVVDIPAKGALDCSRARQAFGYEPKYDLRAGLAANIDYYRQHNA